MSSDEESKGFVVRIRGLPWSASKTDVVTFFSESKIVDEGDGVKFIYGKDARPTGEAFVEFYDQNDMDNAFKKHNKHLGKRYIEVYRSEKSEMEWVMQRAGEDAVKPKEGQCVRLRGLPYGCTKEDIIQFFSELDIKANGITLMTDPNKRPTGEAFVRFTNKEDAEKSMKKHKEKIGHRYIEIFKCSPQEITNATTNMRRMMQRPFYERMPPMPPVGGFMPPPMMRNPGVGRFRGGGGGYGGYLEAYRGLALFDGFMDFAGYGGPRMGPMGPPGGPMGPRMPGAWGDNQGFGGYLGGPGMGGGPGGAGGGGGRPDFISHTGHYVHMRGIPFAATQQDIREFFSGIVLPTNIVFGFNDNGRKNGEADAEFSSHEEALAAMAKNRDYIGPRYIELSLHSSPRRRDMGPGERDYGGGWKDGYAGGFGGAEGRSADFGGSSGYDGGGGGYNRGGSGGYNSLYTESSFRGPKGGDYGNDLGRYGSGYGGSGNLYSGGSRVPSLQQLAAVRYSGSNYYGGNQGQSRGGSGGMGYTGY